MLVKSGENTVHVFCFNLKTLAEFVQTSKGRSADPMTRVFLASSRAPVEAGIPAGGLGFCIEMHRAAPAMVPPWDDLACQGLSAGRAGRQRRGAGGAWECWQRVRQRPLSRARTPRWLLGSRGAGSGSSSAVSAMIKLEKYQGVASPRPLGPIWFQE